MDVGGLGEVGLGRPLRLAGGLASEGPAPVVLAALGLADGAAGRRPAAVALAALRGAARDLLPRLLRLALRLLPDRLALGFCGESTLFRFGACSRFRLRC